MVSRVTMFIIGAAALAAVVICYNLTVKHVSGSSGMAWFEAGCTDQSGPGQMNCAKVLESPYAYIPPKKPGQAGGVHIPASFMGLLYYSAVFLWIVGIGRPSPAKRRWHLVPLFFVGAGLVFSAFFVFVMYRVIHEWCPWCLVTHALNLLIAFGLIVIWPGRERAQTGSVPAPDAPDTNPAQPLPHHPTRRTVALTCIAVLVAYYGHVNMWEHENARKNANAFSVNYNTCLAAVDRIKKNSGLLLQNWQSGPSHAVDRRPDDPVRNFQPGQSTQRALDVVVFSDFECPSCARFAQFFEKNVPALFDHRVRLTYRHFPLDLSCNSLTTSKMHPHACAAARLAEAARLSGGSEAFWKAHDYLYTHRDDIAAGKMTAARVAQAAGISLEDLHKASQLPAAQDRIMQDAEQGKEAGLRGTPYILVEGRPLDPLMAVELGFWDKLADWFWVQELQGPRPQSTIIAPSEAAQPLSDPRP